MTKADVEAILDRVRTWPEQRQQDAAAMLLLLEENSSQVYVLSDEERAAIKESIAELDRGEVATEGEVEAVLSRYRGR